MFNKFFTLCFFSISCAFAYGATNSDQSTAKACTLIQIVSQQPEAIQHYDSTQKKLYLKPEKIIHTPTGFALSNDSSPILLPRLSTDHMGYFLLCGHRRDDYYFTCSNPDCGFRWWFSEYWTADCPKCGYAGE